MSATLLTIITDPEEGAATLCGLPTPSSVIGSTDPNIPMLLRLANQEGRELARRHDWQALTVDYTVAALGAEAQTAFPAAFDRIDAEAEIWNRTTSQKYLGPTDNRVWGQIKGQGITTGAPGWWRILGDTLYITPAPTAGDTLAFYYVSKYWITGSKDHFTADTDTVVLPQRLITLGIVWRYKAAKGLDYAEAMSTYERAVELACSRDKGTQIFRPRPNNRDPLDSRTWPGTISP